MNLADLRPGDAHYKAYVGPPMQYDFMGATQFRLLCTLGLRAHHRLLDFGCGSLRAGKLLMTYLDPQRYHGVEPNAWLIDEAVRNEVGADLVRIKQPRFDHNADFRTDVFDGHFDFIVSHSIFSHAGPSLVTTALRQFKQSLAPEGLIAATFIEGEADCGDTGWVYPGCVRYRHETVVAMAHAAGLQARRIPWFHPRQTWHLLAHDAARLPDEAALTLLSGAVLFDPELSPAFRRRQGA